MALSKDAFRNARRPQRRQMRLIDEALAAGRNVVVDNTNPSPPEWQPIIDLARGHGARVVGYWFPVDVAGSAERNAARLPALQVPDVGIYATLKTPRRPTVADGFDELFVVEFDGRGGFEVRPLGQEG